MTIHIALIGDYNPDVTAHQAIPKALEIAGDQIASPITFDWIATTSFDGVDANVVLGRYDAIWCVPASPYQSLDGALAAIRYARENKVPFLGSCGGYQHAILEYAHNVLGLSNAANAEIDPDAQMPLIAPLTCALIDQDGGIDLVQGSLIHAHYGIDEISETYRCSYGFNREYAGILDGRDLVISAWDRDGDPRAVELKDHPFFIGTAFQPERSGLRGVAHPLITAFVQAAAKP
ncbi:MAG: CTP synthase [Thalassospira sp.]|uniref:CTP synthase C-terminal region-related (seleno)protein n=1 Tax=Thalassospira sp. TaxID=1912094 RepID=UPI0032EBD47B